MKKNVKVSVETAVYKSHNISLQRINGMLHLFGYGDLSMNDVFNILIWGIKNKNEDAGFWDVKLSAADRQNARPINIIYWLTGDDKIWKTYNNIWKHEWNEMSLIFEEHFDARIARFVKSAKTLGELRNKINKISSEDFYELGIKLELINNDDTLL